MISIEKLIQQLQQCKDNKITLSQTNNKYVQKTAIDIRKDELTFLNTNFEHLNEANYTMDSEYEKLNKENDNIKQSINTIKSKTQDSNNLIPNKSLIIYNENETATLPEIICTLFNSLTNTIDIDINLLYIYGIKNPESFYKSFLLLTKVDFIIKNNTEKKNEVATFKREMAIHYETFYKTLNYRKYKFSRNDMVSNLTNIDNYTDYDLFQYIADYTRTNYIILDIITEKYIDINYNDNDIVPKQNTINKDNNTNQKDKYIIIIKYSANTYLPLMHSTGNHYFQSNILQYISKTYERLIFNKFKEQDLENPARKLIANNNEDVDSIDDTDNIMDQFKTFNIEEAFNNSIRIQNENSIINMNTHMNTNTMNLNTIEDMIDIEEIETKPMSSMHTSTSTSINNILKEVIPEPEIITENSIEPIDEPIDEPIKLNDVELLMNKIPMSSGSKKDKAKVKITTKKEIVKDDKPTATTDITNAKEELLPIGKYNLADLQRLCLLHKIDTQKMGTASKKVNKLKAELYLEISQKI
jgi:hypothetical protein